MTLKLFWRAPWESGDELNDEYRSWLKTQEEVTGFKRGEIQRRGNWVIIPYRVTRPLVVGIRCPRQRR